MTPNKNRRNAWLAVFFILAPFVWTIPTFFYLRAQTQAKNASCESNLKALHAALQKYAHAHRGQLPNAKNWTTVTPNSLRCPADIDAVHPVSYAMNTHLSGKKLSAVKNPSQVILLYETTAKASIPYGVGENLANVGRETAGQGRHNLVGYRFNFYLMADGTVRRAGTLAERKALKWTP